jgi:nucleotide-binding universal stress UspA family protein
LQADLSVMGSHGRNALEKLVLGSVAQAVLSHTKLPVLMVRDAK